MVRRQELPKFYMLGNWWGNAFYCIDIYFRLSTISETLALFKVRPASWSCMELALRYYVVFKERSNDRLFIFMISSLLRHLYQGTLQTFAAENIA